MIPDAEFAEMKKRASLTVKTLVREVEDLRSRLLDIIIQWDSGHMGYTKRAIDNARAAVPVDEK